MEEVGVVPVLRDRSQRIAASVFVGNRLFYRDLIARNLVQGVVGEYDRRGVGVNGGEARGGATNEVIARTVFRHDRGLFSVPLYSAAPVCRIAKILLESNVCSIEAHVTMKDGKPINDA